MSVWGKVFAATYDGQFTMMERGGLSRMRDELLQEVQGRTLEIGAGTGLNLEHYPAEGVDLVLTEPEEPMARRLERKAAAARPNQARVVRATADNLPFEAGEFDYVVSTLVLCTVPDQAKALAEIQRVLKPSGRFLFMEHVRSQTPRLAGWQDRLQPIWFRFAYGCHCNVDTLPAIEAGGFSVERLQKGDIPRALPIMRPVITGRAVLA